MVAGGVKEMVNKYSVVIDKLDIEAKFICFFSISRNTIKSLINPLLTTFAHTNVKDTFFRGRLYIADHNIFPDKPYVRFIVFTDDVYYIPASKDEKIDVDEIIKKFIKYVKEEDYSKYIIRVKEGKEEIN